MAARSEQETTVTVGRDDEYVQIWTNNPVHARKLDSDPRVLKIATSDGRNGEWGGSYRVPVTAFDPLKGFKRRSKPLTDEQRAELKARLADARKAI